MKQFFTLVSLLLLAAVAHPQGSASTMTNASIIKLVKSGLDNDIIITTIESSNGKYDLSADGLVSLKNAGVPAPVIKTMLAKANGGTVAKSTGSSGSTGSSSSVKSNGRIPEPEIINAVYAYQRPSNQLTALEKSNATQRVHRAALGYASTSYVCEIPGEKSAVRLKPEEAASFVVNTGAAAPDAMTLFKLEVKKKQRFATTSKVTGMGSMKGAQGSFACNIKSLKTGVYEIVPTEKLEKGEYFFITKTLDFTTMANMDVYAFGID